MIRGLTLPPTRHLQIRPHAQSCLCCGQAGHLMRNCPSLAKAAGNDVVSQATRNCRDREQDLVMVGRTSISDFCHVPICIEGVPCTALVDTGSTVTVVRSEVVPVNSAQ